MSQTQKPGVILAVPFLPGAASSIVCGLERPIPLLLTRTHLMEDPGAFMRRRSTEDFPLVINIGQVDNPHEAGMIAEFIDLRVGDPEESPTVIILSMTMDEDILNAVVGVFRKDLPNTRLIGSWPTFGQGDDPITTTARIVVETMRLSRLDGLYLEPRVARKIPPSQRSGIFACPADISLREGTDTHLSGDEAMRLGVTSIVVDTESTSLIGYPEVVSATLSDIDTWWEAEGGENVPAEAEESVGSEGVGADPSFVTTTEAPAASGVVPGSQAAPAPTESAIEASVRRGMS